VGGVVLGTSARGHLGTPLVGMRAPGYAKGRGNTRRRCLRRLRRLVCRPDFRRDGHRQGRR
jgi:hypothetical protein